ncbi:MAG TPA: DUF3445 domain-containing protein [Acidimicrobiales bacterium]|nr:DUF3445 domain-containing protein [Acidimicrobiales bacterium]
MTSSATRWVDEIAAAPGPPFLPMGLRSLAPEEWLDRGESATSDRAAKAAVLAAHRDEVVAALPGTGAAARELLALVAPGPAPGPARGDGATGGPPGGEPPLVAAALAVAEDLCLVVPGPAGGWVLGAGVVCFPSHWRLRSKLGRPIAEVHGPVPHYADELATRVDRFLDRLTPNRAAWRRNWMVHSHDHLYAPVAPPAPDPPVTAADAGGRLWLRSERQTLRRLPETGAIVFTIRTQQARLADAVAGSADPAGLRHRLAAAVAAWSGDLVAYRGGDALRAALLGWLRAGER